MARKKNNGSQGKPAPEASQQPPNDAKSLVDLLPLHNLKLDQTEGDEINHSNRAPSKRPPRKARNQRSKLQANAASLVPATQPPPASTSTFTGRTLRSSSRLAQSKEGSQAPVGRWLGTPPVKRTSRSTELADVPQVPRPNPTEQYLLNTDVQPRLVEEPQRLLLVLDLNGTLVHRPDRKRSGHFEPRPGLERFVQYILREHVVMVWSSAREENVLAMCSGIFTSQQRNQIIAIWGRSTLDLTKAQYNAKVQVYKRLDKIWANQQIAATHPGFADGQRWSQANTVLIDDSSLKAAAQPHNLLQIPEFLGLKNQTENDALDQVRRYLENLRFQSDVSAFIRRQPFKLEGPLVETSESEGDSASDSGVRLW